MSIIRTYLISYIHSLSNKYYHRKFLFSVAKRMGLSGLKYFHHKKADMTGFRSLIDISVLSSIDSSKMVTGDLWKRYYKKRCFHILGTGWVKWTYDEEPLGFEGIKIDSKIKEIFNSEIAWLRDMRTGYCFNQDSLIPAFFDKLEKGADIKVPWELARMYHWPQLALLALWDIKERSYIIDEFIFEVEDFQRIPVGKSIHYSCAMEVAIRAVNLLIAFDIFTQIDVNKRLSEDFRERFISFMKEHLEEILNKLEVNLETGKNGNHYLADLCGLLFLCSYIQGRETDRCFEFAYREFLKEIDAQFLEDGTNIECSTAYHRLASELSILGMVMIQKAGRDIPDAFYKKLFGMREFLYMIKKPDGRMLQIGDNDSGRVLYLNPKGIYVDVSELEHFNVNWKNYRNEQDIFFLQEELSVEHVIAMFDAFFDKRNEKDEVAFRFYKSMIGNEKFKAGLCESRFKYYEVKALNINYKKLIFQKETIIYFPKKYNFSKKDVFASASFGLIVIKQEDLFLAIRTVPDYGKMRMGHAHNDVMHYELFIDDVEWFGDQGSYVYTGHREWRERFRSDEFHNVPIYQDKWIKAIDMFKSISKVCGEYCLCDNIILVTAKCADVFHVRYFQLYEDKMIVKDFSNKKFGLSKMTNNTVRSLGYGMRTKG